MVVLGGIVGKIPMAALVGVMIMVSISTFDWHSIAPRTLKRMPKSEIAVMGVTVAVTVATDNLSYGVIAGVLVALTLFARRVAHLVDLSSTRSADATTRTYVVTGELFFASSNDLYGQFDYNDPAENVVIDLSGAHLWDASTTATLDAVTDKFRRHGRTVEIIGLDEHSTARHERLSGHLGGGH